MAITIYKAKLNVRYKARKQFFDRDNNLLGEKYIVGIWKGDTTVKGSTVVNREAIRRKVTLYLILQPTDSLHRLGSVFIIYHHKQLKCFQNLDINVDLQTKQSLV